MEPEILFNTLTGQYGDIGLITLNRPKILNALTLNMCSNMYTKLHEWEQNKHIKAIVIKGAGERAFCAGGDIRAVYELRSQPELARQFFWHEYRLNHCIHNLRKPYIALLDGLTMGGGAGVSVNGRYRIGTEKLVFAMPETGIGFFPDVGGSYFLPRCREHIGWYLALTGASINVADALYAGLIDAHLSSVNLEGFIQALINAKWDDNNVHGIVRKIITEFEQPAEVPSLLFHAQIIASCFAQTQVEAILSCLNQQRNSAWAQEVAASMATRSPTSLKVVLEQLHRGAQLDFAACLQMEYRITCRFLQAADFFEGVRAAVIDKDRNPHWQPNKLTEVAAGQIAKFFELLPAVEELHFKNSI